MSRKAVWSSVVVVAICSLATLSAFASGPIVMHEVKHDVSLPVRDLATGATAAKPSRPALLNPNRIVPIGQGAPGASASADALSGKPLPWQVSTTNILNFDGLGATGFVPPDTNGSVGSTQFVETVNLNYAVFDKTTGAMLLGPTSISTIWSGFGGSCATTNQSDPIVLWDKTAQRWFISIVAFNSSFNQFLQCMAVSTTSDATGSYNRYSFSFGTSLNDFPKFAVWPDAYYGSYNMFANSGVSFTGAQVCAYDRAAMLAGSTATSVCFQRTAVDYSMLASDLDGTTAPPAGEPNLYVEHRDTANINLFKFHVDFVNTANSTFTGPTIIPVTPWTQLCPTSRVCITEPSPGEKLDGRGDKLHYRNAYRNFGDHETLVLTHNIDKGGSIAEVRWYEIRNPNGTPTIFQQGNVAAGPSLWMSSIAMDKLGDIALGFNAASTTIKPSAIYTGRVPTDTLGKMESPNKAALGTGVQLAGGGNRWGDYASMSIDPADDCTFWSAQEYYKTNGSSSWTTRLTKFKFNSCN